MDRNLMPCILEGPGDPMRFGAISRIEADEELLSHGIPGIQAGQHIRIQKHLWDYTSRARAANEPHLRRARGPSQNCAGSGSSFGMLVKPSDMCTDGRAPTLEASRTSTSDLPTRSWRLQTRRARARQRLTRTPCRRHETRTQTARLPGQKALPIKDKAPIHHSCKFVNGPLDKSPSFDSNQK